MRLILDYNLSPKLVRMIADLFPAVHLSAVGLHAETPDRAIWQYARENGLTILTCDSDFVNLVEQYGIPPKVIRLQSMTCRTRTASDLIRRNAVLIEEFAKGERGLLNLKFE